jgi:ubiquinone/menaquinone biosynthesis C-methylase UbiE
MALFTSGSAYEDFMGRYSRRLAPLFAEFAGISSGMAVADVGAGTGALTAELVRLGATVAAADPSPEFVASLRQNLPDVEAHQAPAEQLPWPDGAFDAVLAQLVVTFMRDAPAGVAEMRRVVRPGGTVAACMWDREGMELLAAVNRTQGAFGSSGPMPEARTLYRTREEIESLFADGFGEMTSELLEVECSYRDFDELWTSLLGGVGPAGAWAVSLGVAERDAARAELHRQLGEPGGSFALRARAWATRARLGT